MCNAYQRRADDTLSDHISVLDNADHMSAFDAVGLLQAGLGYVVSETPMQKWSARKTLFFIVVTCGLFWLAIAGVTALLLR